MVVRLIVNFRQPRIFWNESLKEDGVDLVRLSVDLPERELSSLPLLM